MIIQPNSSRQVQNGWTENYLVLETRYQDQRWWRSENLVVVGLRECDNKRRVLKIPPDLVSITHEARVDVRLTLHKDTVSRMYVDFMGCGCYSLEEITRADFRAPEGYRLPEREGK